MSSSLIVPIAEIDAVKPHPSADKLEVIELLGWQCCVGKGEFKAGDRVVYFPPDCVLPEKVSDALGVTKYLSKGRVRQIRLRGEPSFGFVFSIYNPQFAPDAVTNGALLEWYLLKSKNIGDNVADFFRATKYEPPVKFTQGDAAPDVALFQKYTDIENFRHYPYIIEPGENVSITEKIHGRSMRVGLVEHEGNMQLMVGSHSLRRKEVPEEQRANNAFWYVTTLPGIVPLLNEAVAQGSKQVIIYGENYGKGVQSFQYDSPHGRKFRVFGIMIDGRYLDRAEFVRWTDAFELETVPTLYSGPFSLDVLRDVVKGESVLGGNIKEGGVITPWVERTNPKVGRVIMKYLSDDYLLSKHSDFKDV